MESVTKAEKNRLVLSTKEVAQLLGTSPANVRMLVYRGKLPARKLGGRLVFLREELEDYLKSLPRAVKIS